MDEDVFMIAVIDEKRQNLEKIAERVSRVIECAAFSSDLEDNNTFTVDSHIKLTELSAIENSDAFIKRSLHQVKKDAAA